MDLTVVIVVAFIFAAIGALIAVRMKNRSPWLGALLGFLLGLIGIGIILIIPKRRGPDDNEQRGWGLPPGGLRDPRTDDWNVQQRRDPGWPPPPAKPPPRWDREDR